MYLNHYSFIAVKSRVYFTCQSVKECEFQRGAGRQIKGTEGRWFCSKIHMGFWSKLAFLVQYESPSVDAWLQKRRSGRQWRQKNHLPRDLTELDPVFCFRLSRSVCSVPSISVAVLALVQGILPLRDFRILDLHIFMTFKTKSKKFQISLLQEIHMGFWSKLAFLVHCVWESLGRCTAPAAAALNAWRQKSQLLTAKRILERLGWQTSSSFAKI